MSHPKFDYPLWQRAKLKLKQVIATTWSVEAQQEAVEKWFGQHVIEVGQEYTFSNRMSAELGEEKAREIARRQSIQHLAAALLDNGFFMESEVETRPGDLPIRTFQYRVLVFGASFYPMGQNPRPHEQRAKKRD